MSEIKNSWVCALDEVGYGAFCGPVCVCGIRCLKSFSLTGLNDSKQLSKKKREQLDLELRKLADKGEIEFFIAERSNTHIDTYGIAVSLRECYSEAVLALYRPGDIIILDGNVNFLEGVAVNQKDIIIEVGADSKFMSVMSASIIAKVYRDNLMTELGKEYLAYDWDKNSGYNSKSHKQAMRDFGYTPLHRKSYKIRL